MPAWNSILRSSKLPIPLQQLAAKINCSPNFSPRLNQRQAMLGSGWRQGRWRRSSSCNEVSAKVCTYNEFRGEGVGSDHGGGVKSGVQRLLLKFQTRRTCTCQCAFAVRGAAVVRIWIMWHYHAMCWCIFSCPGGSIPTLYWLTWGSHPLPKRILNLWKKCDNFTLNFWQFYILRPLPLRQRAGRVKKQKFASRSEMAQCNKKSSCRSR